jgi:hypothetical protein
MWQLRFFPKGSAVADSLGSPHFFGDPGVEKDWCWEAKDS